MNKAVVRVVVMFIVGAVLALAAVVYQSHRKAQLGRTLLLEFKDGLGRLALDAGERTHAEALAEQFHADAYARSFGPDAPSLGGTTDVNAYQRSLLSSMFAQATRDGREGLAIALGEFKNTGTELDLRDTGGDG